MRRHRFRRRHGAARAYRPGWINNDEGQVYPTNGETTAEETDAAPAGPVLRSFRTEATLILRDGQSTMLSDSADPITGETVKTEVTLQVVK